MKKYILSVLVLAAVAAEGFAQQGYSYTQYMNNLVPYNAAAALFEKTASLQVIGRRQWTGIDDAPQTLLFNGSMPLERLNAGAGLIFAQEKYGVKSMTDVNAFFAKAVNISEDGQLALAINAGFNKYLANFNSLSVADPLFKDNIDQSHVNVGAALMWYQENYFLGASIPRFTTLWNGNGGPNKVNNQYYLTAGAKFRMNEAFELRPQALVSYSKSLPAMVNFSALVFVNKQYGAGLDYQSNNMVSAILSMNLGSFNLGYSYQFYAGSGALNNLGGSHELGLGYRFGRVQD